MSGKNIMKVLDPRMQFSTGREFLALRGASTIMAVQIQQSTPSNNSINITCNPPSNRIALAREVFLHLNVNITLNALGGTNTTNPALPLMIPGQFGPRAYPIASVIANETITLNGTSLAVNNGLQFWKALLHENADIDVRQRDYSITPSMMDNSGDYLTGAAATSSTRNPLGSWDSSYEDTRAAYTGFNITSNVAGATAATATLDCYEPVRIDPLQFGRLAYRDSAMIGMNTMTYAATLNNLNRMVSMAYITQSGSSTGTYTIGSVQVNIVQAELLFLNMTPSEDIPLPISTTYPYGFILDNSYTYPNSIAPGALATMTLSNISFGSIPRKMFIFVPVQPESIINTSAPISCTVPDTFLSLYNSSNPDFHPLNVTFDARPNFQGHTAIDLYKMCQKNGLSLSWNEWATMPANAPNSTGVGSILVLNFGDDITLGPDQAPGCLGQYQFSATITFKNTTQHVLPSATLHYTAIMDGSIHNEDGHLEATTGDLTREEIAKLEVNPHIKFIEHETVLGGGNFWGSVKDAWAKVRGFIKNNHLISAVTPMISKALTGVNPAFGPIVDAIGTQIKKNGYGTYAGGGRRGKSLRARIEGGGEVDEYPDNVFDD